MGELSLVKAFSPSLIFSLRPETFPPKNRAALEHSLEEKNPPSLVHKCTWATLLKVKEVVPATSDGIHIWEGGKS